MRCIQGKLKKEKCRLYSLNHNSCLKAPVRAAYRSNPQERTGSIYWCRRQVASANSVVGGGGVKDGKGWLVREDLHLDSHHLDILAPARATVRQGVVETGDTTETERQRGWGWGAGCFNAAGNFQGKEALIVVQDISIPMMSQKSLFLFLSEKARLATFEDWPNDTSGYCTPERLAQAGFYFLPCDESPDNVCCVFCGKELDGWEPDDNPLEEHKKHSKACPFLAMPKSFSMENSTIQEGLELLKNVHLRALENQIKKKEKECEEYAATVEKAIKDHVLG
ncbi:baculoviral IAP repeat-containing protein 5 [Elysia marginata]|uniref:Baculoviral IAP repeat-containing protein 5 n=1 Tax=Elysia marginata TaxID=1093978 RepID=A0AAV4IE24_9GAST|nr:baculoviral IAP repeat-containing protein 5 [Elysia marginata]